MTTVALGALLPTVDYLINHGAYVEAFNLIESQLPQLDIHDSVHAGVILFEIATAHFDITIEQAQTYLQEAQNLRAKNTAPLAWLLLQSKLLEFNQDNAEFVAEAFQVAQQQKAREFIVLFGLANLSIFFQNRQWNTVLGVSNQILEQDWLPQRERILFQLIHVHADLLSHESRRGSAELLKRTTAALATCDVNDPKMTPLWGYCCILNLSSLIYEQKWGNPQIGKFLNLLEQLTKTYKSDDIMLQWLTKENLKIFWLLFQGLRHKRKARFEKAEHVFRECLELIGEKNQLSFFIRCQVIRGHLAAGRLTESADSLNREIDDFHQFQGSDADKQFRALYLHSLITHLAIHRREVIHAKNQLKRLYRVSEAFGTQQSNRFPTQRIYSRLQLAMLRMQLSRNQRSESDMKKAIKELQKYLKEVQTMQPDLGNSGKRTPNFALEVMAHIGFVLWNAENYNQCKIQIEETLHLLSRLDDTFLTALLKCIMSTLYLRTNNLERAKRFASDAVRELDGSDMSFIPGARIMHQAAQCHGEDMRDTQVHQKLQFLLQKQKIEVQQTSNQDTLKIFEFVSR